ncbi:hypothetical protein SAMN05216203_3173 [Marinobacter daqiaonensis]|uniref:VanZ like family protein n=1 Tax=Marinobacter daqiaonensis TaxID=650891 RepID=A0A1I6JQZ9_9GAMM|nr:VanZ family protein [Marinobacter daqiaonensis]SFR81394.1 hypothetical protein SAMN05216203_3173 [Marinobacter daqiaonensis]
MRLHRTLNILLDNQLLWRVLFTASLMLIAWLGFTSQPYPIPSSASDKVNHFLAFAELAFLARLGWPTIGLRVPFVVLTGFGLALELGQAMTPWRQFSLYDLGADMMGILAGFGLVAAVLRLMPGRPE